MPETVVSEAFSPRLLTRCAATVLLDIEGTIGSKSFVTQVMFPYASRHLRTYVAQHSEDPVVRQALADTRALSGTPNVDPVDTLLEWIAQDRKAPPLKKLQGLVWRGGFESGVFRGHLYADALRALRAWHGAGLSLALYSSGSVQSQRLYFAHSVDGNLLPLFVAHFDTDVGAKTEAHSYTRIADALQQAPRHIVFLSDSAGELEAARDAGLQVLHVVREDTEPDPRFATVTDFGALHIQALA
jgi:enolase-phosphatase E1